MRNLICLLLCLISSASCNFQKHYAGTDYSFYKSDFQLDSISLLRTDGVYVLKKIWTDQNGGTERAAKEKRVYKFYASGQVNLILDFNGQIKTNSDYVQAFNQKITDSQQQKSTTLFEGYYKLEGEKMVIQSRVTPREQFTYDYFLLEKNGVVQVSSTIDGKGKIKDKYFTAYYKAHYTFVPASGDYLKPNW